MTQPALHNRNSAVRSLGAVRRRGAHAILLALALFVAAAAAACGGPEVNHEPPPTLAERRSRLVLTIAIDDYRADAVESVAGAGADADALHRLLTVDAAPDEVTVQHVSLRGADATRQRIRDQIATLAASAGSADTIIISFHGLGAAFRLQGTFSMPQGPTRLFLAPYDMVAGDVERVRDSCLAVDDFLPVFQSRARNVCLVLDAGFTGDSRTLTSETIEQAQLEQLELHLLSKFGKRQGRTILLSGTLNDPCTIDESGRSLFAAAVAEALDGSADLDLDYTVTLQELIGHARRIVPQRTDRRQQPIAYGTQISSNVMRYLEDSGARVGTGDGGDHGTGSGSGDGDGAGDGDGTRLGDTGAATGFESIDSSGWALNEFFEADFTHEDAAEQLGLTGNSNGARIEAGSLVIPAGSEYVIPVEYGDAALTIELSTTPRDYTLDELELYGTEGPPPPEVQIATLAGPDPTDPRYVMRLAITGHYLLCVTDQGKVVLPTGGRADEQRQRAQSPWTRLDEAPALEDGDRLEILLRVQGDTLTVVIGELVVERLPLPHVRYGDKRGRFALGVTAGADLHVNHLAVAPH